MFLRTVIFHYHITSYVLLFWFPYHPLPSQTLLKVCWILYPCSTMLVASATILWPKMLQVWNICGWSFLTHWPFTSCLKMVPSIWFLGYESKSSTLKPPCKIVVHFLLSGDPKKHKKNTQHAHSRGEYWPKQEFGKGVVFWEAIFFSVQWIPFAERPPKRYFEKRASSAVRQSTMSPNHPIVSFFCPWEGSAKKTFTPTSWIFKGMPGS